MSDASPLGRSVPFPDRYAPELLHAIDRAPSRAAIGAVPAPFVGEDVWHCYELSWLSTGGLPRAAVLRLRVPSDAPALVESKSLKLYLGSLSLTAFVDAEAVRRRVERDVAKTVGCDIVVEIMSPAALARRGDHRSFCLDDLDLDTTVYQRDPTLLRAQAGQGRDAVHTHLFRSLCPATGQPDWGSVAIAWRGRLLDRRSLLAYLVSYRCSAGFHEDAVERIFMDVRQVAAASWLVVDGRFLRRGGIDINPFRSTHAARAPVFRLWRQ